MLAILQISRIANSGMFLTKMGVISNRILKCIVERVGGAFVSTQKNHPSGINSS